MTANRYLLDTHTFLWWILKQPGLSARAESILQDRSNDVMVSAVSCWEMLIKYRLGKLAMPPDLAYRVEEAAVAAGFRTLSISVAHAQRTVLLPRFSDHKDPFDRMLIAQALIERCTLISNEEIFDQYGVHRAW